MLVKFFFVKFAGIYQSNFQKGHSYLIIPILFLLKVFFFFFFSVGVGGGGGGQHSPLAYSLYKQEHDVIIFVRACIIYVLSGHIHNTSTHTQKKYKN